MIALRNSAPGPRTIQLRRLRRVIRRGDQKLAKIASDRSASALSQRGRILLGRRVLCVIFSDHEMVGGCWLSCPDAISVGNGDVFRTLLTPHGLRRSSPVEKALSTVVQEFPLGVFHFAVFYIEGIFGRGRPVRLIRWLWLRRALRVEPTRLLGCQGFDRIGYE